MITRENVLKLKARQEIYNFISKNIGLHLREISRKINIPPGVLSYHLKCLMERDLIISKSQNGYTRYFPTNKVGTMDQKLLCIFRESIPRKILLLLSLEKARRAEYYGLTKKEMIKLMKPWWKWLRKKHRTTLDFHLNKLREAGIIESFRVGKEVGYRIQNPPLLLDFYIRYQKVIADPDIDFALAQALGWIDTWTVDNLIEAFFDIIPHPYHV
jgi:DNA-binding transcriptional ArsR family regulator